MKDNPLIVGLVAAFLVVVSIAAVSFLVKMNSYSEAYKKEASHNMSLQEQVETLKAENTVLKTKSSELKYEVDSSDAKFKDLKNEVAGLEKLKQKLEENLKEALVNKELERQPKANVTAGDDAQKQIEKAVPAEVKN
jgi:predicted RNase H-like nuclease (RuvC/YqgF family)